MPPVACCVVCGDCGGIAGFSDGDGRECACFQEFWGVPVYVVASASWRPRAGEAMVEVVVVR